MFKYDIPYPKSNQMTLTLNGIPINVSKNKSYLVGKMKAHRVLSYEEFGSWPAAEYAIVDSNGKLIFKKIYTEGEKAVSNEPYNKVTKDTTNYISKDGFELIADEQGNILTDEKLLHFLRDFIYANRLPIHNSKQVSVQLATYMPTTKSEFVALKGLGEKMYDKCGEILLEVVKAYLE